MKRTARKETTRRKKSGAKAPRVLVAEMRAARGEPTEGEEPKQTGRPLTYRKEFVQIAEQLASLGATDAEVARFFGVATQTIGRWQSEHKGFSAALKLGKEPADARVERSLFHRANGYSYDAEKILVVNGEVKHIPYTEHVPPDTTACIFWLKNRRPAEWRDRVEIRDVTPPDPQAEATRMKMIAFLGKTIEERARLGLPSIFDDTPSAGPRVIEGKVTTPKGGNGHGGNGHG